MHRPIFAGLYLIFTVSAWGQSRPGLYNDFYLVQDFLQLSDAQTRSIFGNNQEYNRWALEKQNRILQVQSEIAVETAKDPVDPHALGLRYMEVELICREMIERAAEVRLQNLKVLTAGQKTRLQILAEAMLLVPTLSQAHSSNLISGVFNPAQATLTAGTVIGTGNMMAVLSSFNRPVSGCSSGMTSVSRAGDFSNP